MLWEVEIRPLGRDGERERVCDEFDLLTHAQRGGDLVSGSARGYLLEGDLGDADLQRLTSDVLVDPLVETVAAAPLASKTGQLLHRSAQAGRDGPGRAKRSRRREALAIAQFAPFARFAATSERRRSRRSTATCCSARCSRTTPSSRSSIGPVKADHLALGSPYTFKLSTVPIAKLDDAGLVKLSKDGQLALTLDEMKAIQEHFRELGREPTDCELETIAQTWSEHCSHKTLKGTITLADKTTGETRSYKNLLKETIFGATQEIRQRARRRRLVRQRLRGQRRRRQVRRRAITSASRSRRTTIRRRIEPYGGANTGLGGVIRDLLGTGLGAKPICNTDVFCFAPPDSPAGAAAAGRAASAAGDAAASSPACATTATAWAFRRSTARSSSTSATWPTRSSSAARSASSRRTRRSRR